MIFKNLKIEINETQPVDVVLEQLERLGYKPLNSQAIKEWHKWLVADCDGIVLVDAIFCCFSIFR